MMHIDEAVSKEEVSAETPTVSSNSYFNELNTSSLFLLESIQTVLHGAFSKSLLKLTSFNFDIQHFEEDSSSLNNADYVTPLVMALAKHSTTKQFDVFLQQLFSPSDQEDILHTSSSFAIIPMFSFLLEYYSTLHNNSFDWELQAGGGAGMGFQLYCLPANTTTFSDEDSQRYIHLTAGYGGGGGTYLDRNITSFGAGGGGGMQWIQSEEDGNGYKRLSFGGGGGCGSASSTISSNLSIEQSKLIPVECGWTYDNDDNSRNKSLQEDWRRQHPTWADCDEVFIEGGGGGGGGGHYATSPSSYSTFAIGYGFSFTLSTSPDIRLQRMNDVTTNDSVSDSNTMYRKYNLMGEMFSEIAASYCQANSSSLSSSGDNWCCLCSTSQNIVSNCLQQPHANTSLASISCEDIEASKDRLAWIVDYPCCNHDSFTSPQTRTNQSSQDHQTPNPFVLYQNITLGGNFTMQIYAHNEGRSNASDLVRDIVATMKSSNQSLLQDGTQPFMLGASPLHGRNHLTVYLLIFVISSVSLLFSIFVFVNHFVGKEVRKVEQRDIEVNEDTPLIERKRSVYESVA